MKELLEKLKSENLQEVIEELKVWPLLHFSESAESILNDGFLNGADLKQINLTPTEKKKEVANKEGYHFAFNVLEYCYERDVPDYMVGIDSSLMGMFNEKAVLFLGSGVYTRHYDEFNQVIFKTPDVDINSFLLLENKGVALDEDNEPMCDENGNEFDYWIVKDRDGKEIDLEENMTLEECVKHATHYLLSNFKASPKAYEEYSLMYDDMPSPAFKEQPKLSKRMKMR
jgi:hypothetical protein